MEPLSTKPLWNTFPPEMCQQIIHLWTELLRRQIISHRFAQKGETDERPLENPTTPPEPSGAGLYPQIPP